MAGYAGKFGRLCEKEILTPYYLNEDETIDHVNVLLLKQITRVYYSRSFISLFQTFITKLNAILQ